MKIHVPITREVDLEFIGRVESVSRKGDCWIINSLFAPGVPNWLSTHEIYATANYDGGSPRGWARIKAWYSTISVEVAGDCVCAWTHGDFLWAEHVERKPTPPWKL